MKATFYSLLLVFIICLLLCKEMFLHLKLLYVKTNFQHIFFFKIILLLFSYSCLHLLMNFSWKFFIDWFFFFERDQFVVPPIHALTGWFFYVPWPGIEPTTLVYRDNGLTNWATWPGLFYIILKNQFFSTYTLMQSSANRILY